MANQVYRDFTFCLCHPVPHLNLQGVPPAAGEARVRDGEGSAAPGGRGQVPGDGRDLRAPRGRVPAQPPHLHRQRRQHGRPDGVHTQVTNAVQTAYKIGITQWKSVFEPDFSYKQYHVRIN